MPMRVCTDMREYNLQKADIDHSDSYIERCAGGRSRKPYRQQPKAKGPP